MSVKLGPLPKPTLDIVQSSIYEFDQTQTVVENALSKIFLLFPKNTVLEDILLKVVTLNDLYRTGILATYKVAEHILQSNIDLLLNAEESLAVERIAHIQLGNKIRNNYSFATKYCAWHNPNGYPIYDSFVEKMLWGYQKQDQFTMFLRQDLWEYKKFKRIFIVFREHYNLSTLSLKDIDKFLWIAGQKYFPPSWKQNANTPQ